MNRERVKVAVRGAVQGVGFRPFVYRLATGLGLKGWVLNSSSGVFLEVEGRRPALNEFLLRLEREKPPRAIIQSLESSFLDPVGHARFEIRPSEDGGAKRALILPDIATCADCRREIFDPRDRRHLYPFTNCVNCGPRFSILESLPYDRPNTSMKNFSMCAACLREYHDPASRRFHAQPNACPDCGPQLELWNADGGVLGQRGAALREAAHAVRAGQILALKGVGGFQLLVDARNEEAVRRLRLRKHREEKPFALMFPSLDALQSCCRVGEFEERLLRAPEAPIVLLDRRGEAGVLAPAVAPRNPQLGALLPYSPLHHLLLHELGFPVVATSGNLSDEPICLEEHEALQRLRGVADVFLVHDRPIVRHVDDSVARILLGREQVLRRARGYAPLPITFNAQPATRNPQPILAVGAHLKNTVALGVGNDIFISQHIGDLETPPALAAFRRVVADFERLYDTTPDLVACDLHPEYLSTKHAKEMGVPLAPVQHHYAHIAACMAENEIAAPALGVSWDGTGYGLDGTIWGGEFLRVDESSFQRYAHLRTFRLPGGEAAIKQPRRAALGLLREIFGDEVFQRHDLLPVADFPPNELALVRQVLARGVNSPVTSSAGRLFDAVAAMLGLRQRVHFEGQAAMELEFAIQPGVEESYPFELREETSRIVDWQPMMLEMLEEIRLGGPAGLVAAKFHNTLVEMIVAVARLADVPKVVLSGGCFQNKYLAERTVRRLQAEAFRPYWPQRVPPNDGGIALGQVAAAIRARQPKPQLEEALLV